MKWTRLVLADMESKLQAERVELLRTLLPSVDPSMLPTDPVILLHPDDYEALASTVRSRNLEMADLPVSVRSSGLVNKGEALVIPNKPAL